MKIGDLVKCKGKETQHTKAPDLFGVIVKLEHPQRRNRNSTLQTTWAQIQWSDGHRTWEDWETSVECGSFEVIA